jgi:uncharacterized protein (DUF1499 family)
MSTKSHALVFLLLVCSTSSLSLNRPPPTRKQALNQLVGSATAAFVLASSPSIAEAALPKKPPPYLAERGSEGIPLSPCNGQPVKKSCWSTEDQAGRKLHRWTPPKELKDTASVVKTLEETIATYPQAGQADIDKGGWRLAERKEGNGVTYIRYEFTSGRFKYVDDLELRVSASSDGSSPTVVCTRSASQNGGFDYDVNKTRLNYIANALKQKGWDVKLL